jgi:2-phosphoglycerate kinase
MSEQEYLVVIIRGVPGAGKSDFAKFIAGDKGKDIICEADDYHYNDKGVYEFKRENLSKAHNMCFDKFKTLIDNKEPLVIVSNTSTVISEFSKYLLYGKDNGYRVTVTIVENYRDGESIHNIPADIKQAMKDRFQYSL